LKQKKIIFSLVVLFALVAISTTRQAFGASFETFKKRAREVLVVNDGAQPIPVSVQNQQEVEQWEYWYQCHPNPTNEGEIRGYLNDRGLEGWEVVAAAGSDELICEYYKRPKDN